MNNVIELENIVKIYKTGGQNTMALNEINMAIKEGEFVAIMGPSGSGKSTLMNIIGLLDVLTSGVYLFEGKDISKINKNKQATIRNQQIGFVFQQFNLLPRTTVLDNVLLPTIYGHFSKSVERANQVIKDMGLGDKTHNRSNQLSGGETQRVAIARALMMNPSILLADEPTGNIDTKTSKEIMEIFKMINQKGTTIVLITHEMDIAKFASRFIRLRDGQIISSTED